MAITTYITLHMITVSLLAAVFMRVCVSIGTYVCTFVYECKSCVRQRKNMLCLVCVCVFALLQPFDTSLIWRPAHVVLITGRLESSGKQRLKGKHFQQTDELELTAPPG